MSIEDITPAKLFQLSVQAIEPAPFGADSFDRSLSEQKARHARATLRAYEISLRERQAVAFERLADALSPNSGPGFVDRLEDCINRAISNGASDAIATWQRYR